MIKLIFSFLIFNSLLLISGLVIFYQKLPHKESFNSCFTTSMYELKICKNSNDYVDIKNVNSNLIKSILISEDSLFYQHKGFDWKSIKNNFDETIKTKKIKKGGSTITQQLVKNIYFKGEKTISRKILEAIYTAKIETELSKVEILELYLNIIEFGPDIFGIKKASEYYFQKSPKDLTLVESAFLAMLLPNPTKNSSSFRKKELTSFAYFRIEKIITDLYNFKYISENEYEDGMGELSRFMRKSETDTVSIEVN